MGIDRGRRPRAAHQAWAPPHARSEACLHRVDVHDGEIGVTCVDDSEMQYLLELAARLGRDPLAIQGPGGTISLKRDGVMWVKASGTWMMEATSRSILIPVDFVAVLDGLAAGDPRRWGCQRCSCRPAFIIIC